MNNPIDKSIRCPHCSATSKNIKRCGKDTDGTQLYLCKKCGKKFRLDKTYSEIKSCPYCNEKSPRNIKLIGRTSSGSQRYFCKTCKRSYSNRTILNKKEINNNPNCPYCNSFGVNVVKAGINKRGKQRYKCNACGRYFISEKDKVKVKNISKYNYNYSYGYGYGYGYGSKINPELEKLERKLIPDVICPVCGSVGESIKSGTTGQNRQYYRCSRCGSKYLVPSQKYKRLTEGQIKYLKKCVSKGVSKKQIAKVLNVSPRTIFRHTVEIKGKRAAKRESLLKDIEQLFKNMTTIYGLEIKYGMSRQRLNTYIREIYTIKTLNDLTEEKLNAIISFGKALNIPVEHLYKFVPASKSVQALIAEKYKKGMKL